jgi:hypothetical protein
MSHFLIVILNVIMLSVIRLSDIVPECRGAKSTSKPKFNATEMSKLRRLFWRHDTQHNDIQHYDIQHNNIQHNDIQHNDIQHNDIQHINE